MTQPTKGSPRAKQQAKSSFDAWWLSETNVGTIPDKMIMRVSYVAGFQKGYQVGTAATQTKLMEMEESLREVLNTCFIKRDRKWYFKTHNGIPMEIPKKYIKIMMCAEAILSAPIKLEDNK